MIIILTSILTLNLIGLLALIVLLINAKFKQAAQTHHEVTSGDFPPQVG